MARYRRGPLNCRVYSGFAVVSLYRDLGSCCEVLVGVLLMWKKRLRENRCCDGRVHLFFEIPLKG